jgi:hypothetical protein
MADVTPSPAADGPFSLVSEAVPEELTSSRSAPPITLQALQRLLAEGTSAAEITRLVTQLAADSEGAVPHV